MHITAYVNIKGMITRADLKPTLILLSAAFIPTVHRHFGSKEYFRQLYGSSTGFEQSAFMFSTAFVLLGLIPLAIIVFLFRERIREYGIAVGDWKFGLTATLVLFPVIAVAMLYPASHTTEMIEYYPLDPAAGDSPVAFLTFQLIRGLFFYTAWEFFFRGFLLFGLRERVGTWITICIQTIPSCLWHLGMPNGEIFSSIAGGILFGFLAVRTGSILWPLLLHFLIGVGLDFFIVITA